jgi:acyl-CoA oxidase
LTAFESCVHGCALLCVAECLSLVDLSLMVKSGVQYSLWGGSVLNLGTETHR